MGNYRAFFDFYNPRNDMTRSLLTQYIEKVRMRYLVIECRTFGEKISLEILAETINDDEDELKILITEQGGILTDGFLYLKQSLPIFSQSDLLNKNKHALSLDG